MFRISIQLTRKCNLDCKYCFVEHVGEDMSEEKAIQSINFAFLRAKNTGQDRVQITYFGGEPLLKFDMIKRLTLYAKKVSNDYGISVGFDMTTNGTIFTDEIYDFLLKNKFILALSWDGTKESHDKNRITCNGEGSYDLIDIEKFFQYEKESGIVLQVVGVVDKNNCENMFNDFLYIVNMGGKIIRMSLQSYAEWSEQKLEIAEQEFRKCIEYYIDLLIEGKKIKWTFVDSAIEQLYEKRENSFCGAGVVDCMIDPDGYIYPCTYCVKEEARIGHLDEGYYTERLNIYSEYKRELTDKCEKCDIKNFCGICDCLPMNLESTGNLRETSKTSCEITKLSYRLMNELINSDKWEEYMELNEKNSRVFVKQN